MGMVIFAIVLLNGLLFAGLAAWGIRTALRDPLPRVRVLSWALAAVSGAFVLGAMTRLALLAGAQGWLDGPTGALVNSYWHLLQSLAAMALGAGGVILIRRVGPHVRRSEQIVSALGERFAAAGSISDFAFTTRELDVLAAIGSGSLSDKAIAADLFISPATAATHVKNILRKTGLGSRRDLVLLVAWSAPDQSHRQPTP